MSAETKLVRTGWEIEDVNGGIGFPTYPARVPVYSNVVESEASKQLMYDTEAVATGLPMYLGGTVSTRCVQAATESLEGN
jgi:hypothetical protein